MYRREYLASIGQSCTISLSSSPTELDIRLYQSEQITDLSDDRPFKGLEVLKPYIEVNYGKTFDSYEANVEIVRDPVDLTQYPDRNKYDTWNTITDGSQADCDFLAHDSLTRNADGLGECYVCGDADVRKSAPSDWTNTAIIQYGQILSLGEESIELWKPASDYVASVLMSSIHEIGHCLGLSHDLGYGYELSGFSFEDGDVMSTPMLGSYIHLDVDEQDESHTGRERFRADQDNTYYQMLLGQDAIDFVREYGFNVDW